MIEVSAWIETLVAALLVLSGLLVLASAIGFVRLPDFFLRLHPPALAYTLGCWCVGIAAALYFSALQGRLALHPLLVPVLLSITMPVTTLLLARAALFRQRSAGAPDTPPALAPAATEAVAPPGGGGRRDHGTPP